MMTFEEFFKKKKINLAELQLNEPALFAEFNTHYRQMGEKSFDHTKKYWFNQLRRRFPLPPEVKAEKLVIENKLAEQTITDTLTEPAAELQAKPGFRPKFKPAMVKKAPSEQPEAPAAQAPAMPETATPSQLGFKPGFKPSPANEEVERTADAEKEEAPDEGQVTKPAGFKPRFKPKT